MQVSDDASIPNRMRPRILAVLIATVLVAVAAAYFGALRLFETQAISVAKSQHALYLRSLNEAIKKHQHLPFVLGENPLLAQNLLRDNAAALNTSLAEFSNASGLEAIYVMALDGQVVATSNHASDASFLGQNYGFRPYFQSAAAGKRSDYFAIGATTGRPGYFVAEPLYAATGDVAGVVAIKLDISELQRSWEQRGETVLATNADGIVVLSSNPRWLYHSIADLDEVRRKKIAQSRQFGTQYIPRLNWISEDQGRATVQGQSYFLTSGPTEVVDWTVHYLTSQSAVARQTWLATGVLGFFIAALIGFSVFLRSRRIQAALSVSQRQSRELFETNQRLVKAQQDLERSSKMAALGQLAASVTHELGQPISAFKNHLFAAEIGNEITSAETLNNLRRLADRMEGITKQLRFFARQRDEEWKLTDMALVVDEALALLQHDLEASHVAVKWQAPEPRSCLVNGHQLQLEQAMVNILRNALDASQSSQKPQVFVTCDITKSSIQIGVSDSGPGLQGKSLETLQEPFYSTRSSGNGMGLGLAIASEIIGAHGGEICASDATDGGAVFRITLPSAGRDT